MVCFYLYIYIGFLHIFDGSRWQLRAISWGRPDGHLQCCRRHVRKGPAAPADLASCGSCSATPPRRMGTPTVQPAPLQGSARRMGVIFSAAICAGESPSSTCRPYISGGRCSSRSSRRLWSPIALPAGRAKEPAAFVVLTSLGTLAALGHRPGCGHLQGCQQRG